MGNEIQFDSQVVQVSPEKEIWTLLATCTSNISFLHFILFLFLDSMGFVDHQRPFFNYFFGVQIQQLPVRYLLELLSFYLFFAFLLLLFSNGGNQTVK